MSFFLVDLLESKAETDSYLKRLEAKNKHQDNLKEKMS